MQYESPGFAASQALQQVLLQHQMQERQAMLDALTVQKTKAEIGNEQAARALQALEIEGAQQGRDTAMAKTVAGNLTPGMALDPGTAATLARGGLGVMVAPPKQGPTPSGEALGAGSAGTFTGTQAQQEKAGQDESLNELANSDDPVLRTLARLKQAGVSAPAGLLVPTYQKVVGTVDGKPYVGRFNPKTGETSGPNGEPLPKNFKPGSSNSFMSDLINMSDPAGIAAGIKSGQLPPNPTDYGRYIWPIVSAQLAKQGYPVAQAETDWHATQQRYRTLNGTQQTRLQEAITSLPHTLDLVATLAQQWNAGGFKPLNKANLELAKQGALGQQAQSIATQLDAQIADSRADLAVVYQGGNSPIDRALANANAILDSNWSAQTLLDNIALAKKNIAIRANSINSVGVVSPYGGESWFPGNFTGTGTPNPPGPGATGVPNPAPTTTPPPADLVWDPVTKTFKKGGA